MVTSLVVGCGRAGGPIPSFRDQLEDRLNGGRSTCRKARPSSPGWPPGLRPDRPCSDFGTACPTRRPTAAWRAARGGGHLPLHLRDPRVLLGDPNLQVRDRPLLRRRQLLIGRRGHGPLRHTPTMITT